MSVFLLLHVSFCIKIVCIIIDREFFKDKNYVLFICVLPEFFSSGMMLCTYLMFGVDLAELNASAYVMKNYYFLTQCVK